LLQSLLNVALEWFISLQNTAETTVSATLSKRGPTESREKGLKVTASLLP